MTAKRWNGIFIHLLVVYYNNNARYWELENIKNNLSDAFFSDIKPVMPFIEDPFRQSNIRYMLLYFLQKIWKI